MRKVGLLFCLLAASGMHYALNLAYMVLLAFVQNMGLPAICDAFCRGAKVVVAGSAYGEMAMHFIEKYGMMALRLPSKFDMRRFCR